MNSLYNSVKDTYKKEEESPNADYCQTLSNQTLNFSGIIIADGIGSHFKSDIASKFSCDKLKELLESLDNLENLVFKKLFKQVKSDLIEYAQKTGEFNYDAIDKNQSLSTTLICVLEFKERYEIAYIGNGCIWYVDGRFNQFSKERYLPWNAINLLNPHTIEQDGKEALYRYMSISDAQYIPTVLTLYKNMFTPGEIIIAATDGIYSNDHVPVAKDATGTLWIRGEEKMVLIYEHISRFLKDAPIEANNDDLANTLTQYLATLKEKKMMDDDCAIGVIISPNTIKYHQSLFEKKVKTNVEKDNNQ